MRKITEKQCAAVTVLKIIMLVFSAVYCLFMPFMTGLGLIYNSDSYGAEISLWGALFIVSAVLMSAAAVMCIPRKKALNLLAVIFSAVGCVLCMAMLYKLCLHADSSGWSDKFTMEQISYMYRRRLIPCIVPVILIIIVSAVQIRKNQGTVEKYTSIL